MKSIGERAYTTVIPAKNFAAAGVSLSFKARNTAGISVLSTFFQICIKETGLVNTLPIIWKYEVYCYE